MKNLFLTFIFVLIGNFAFGNSVEKNPVITNFFIGDTEVKNLDSGRFLFKRTNCEDNGYSYYSPYYENSNLLEAKVFAEIKGEDIEVSVLENGSKINATISNFVLNKDKNTVSFDVKKGNVVFKSKMVGKNLSIDYVRSAFLNLNDSPSLDKDCPMCVVAIVLTAAKVCKDAQSECSPCNGTLEVSLCSCSCKPMS